MKMIGWLRSKERDSQRSKLYKAEGVLIPVTERLSSIEHIEKYVKYIWSLKRVQTAFPKAMRWNTPRVNDGRGRGSAAADTHAIYLPKYFRDTATVLHELAHVITRREYGTKIAGHGWQYCGVYLQLVLYVFGRGAHDILKASMKTHRVRFSEPIKRVITEERREQLRAILVEARAAKRKG